MTSRRRPLLVTMACLVGASLLLASEEAGAQWTPPPRPLPDTPPGSTCVLLQRGSAGNVWESDLAPTNGSWAAGAYPLTWTGLSQSNHWSIYKFDLSPVPAGSQIVLAAFSAYVGWNDQSSTVRLHRVLVPWEEPTIKWTNFGGTASWDPAVIATFNPSGVGHKSVDITDLVQAWHSGALPAHGFLMEEDPVKVHGFYASESTTQVYRPSLYVCYKAGGPCAGLPDGAACNDGNLCTVGDACAAGQCSGGAPVTCQPIDVCHEPGVCDPATGACTTPEKPDGAPCSDDDLCTQNDVCLSGMCAGGEMVTCHDGTACTIDVCDPATGCSNTTVSCDDGNACTADVCDPAAGCDHLPVTCDDNDVCTQDTCDPATGCGIAPISCDDGNACTVDGCHPQNGCSHTAASCNDNNPCTVDSCNVATGCANAPVTCAAPDGCHDAGTCDQGTGQCNYPQKPDGTACSDGTACTQVDTCQSGTCTGASPVVCPPADDCHEAGACNPVTGQCSQAAKPNGTPCNDADACTQVDTCQSGACAGASPVTCAAQDTCHDPGTCDPVTGQCSNPAKANGAICDDGNACTAGDTCQSGACAAGSPVTCPAAGDCHEPSTCDPATGQCSNVAKADGTACSDGTACTQGDTCQAGACASGLPLDCDDENPCTDDVCDAVQGCQSAANTAACDDGDACTTGDQCSGGLCGSTGALSCDDGNACTTDSCDPTSGCGSVALADNTPCGAGVCQGGNCNTQYCANECCEAQGGPGCSDPSVQACVCASDPSCCDTAWTAACGALVAALGCGNCVDPCNDGILCTTDACSPTQGCSHQADATCGGTCDALHADCDGDGANGCEAALDTAQSCGSCGNACPAVNGTAICDSGACGIAGCSPGFANCDCSLGNGCEVNLMTDPQNCGVCGHACVTAGGTGACAQGTCVVQ